jgi:hypothetical protein
MERHQNTLDFSRPWRNPDGGFCSGSDLGTSEVAIGTASLDSALAKVSIADIGVPGSGVAVANPPRVLSLRVSRLHNDLMSCLNDPFLCTLSSTNHNPVDQTTVSMAKNINMAFRNRGVGRWVSMSRARIDAIAPPKPAAPPTKPVARALCGPNHWLCATAMAEKVSFSCELRLIDGVVTHEGNERMRGTTRH